MLELLKKAFKVLRTRPLTFLSYAGQYFRFARTRFFRGLVFTEANGIKLGENVRIQALSCLNADRPAAQINVGDDSIIYELAKIGAYGTGSVTIGEGTIIGDALIYSRASITLGKRVVTSWNVFIQDFDPHPIEPELRALQMRHMAENFRPQYRASRPVPKLDWTFPSAPITIGDDVWLGANVTVLKGARIGNGCLVATGSVVTAGEYPDRSILAGAPAKVVKTLS
ncbi:MAG: acyltransferase [Deltaproteobacteria bacterium]|nr:acyltransferase [Deltaproteobacteria bacterium]